MIPKIGEKYYYFDDGKINLSRRYEILVTGVIPFNEEISEVINDWQKRVKQSHHLFSPQTDFFVKGYVINQGHELIFVRTMNNDWFSFNNYMWDGILDIDGNLNNLLN